MDVLIPVDPEGVAGVVPVGLVTGDGRTGPRLTRSGDGDRRAGRAG